MSHHNLATWGPAESGPAAVVTDEVGMGEVILEISGRALEPAEAGNGAKEAVAAGGDDDDDAVMTPRQENKGPEIPPDAVVEAPYYEMKVLITTPEYSGVPRGGFLISNSAKRVASVLLTDPEPSPVFSFRDKVPDPSKSDFLLILSSIRRRGPAIHMLSLGEVTVLGKDLECIAALVELLEEGYIYACDFGELRFTTEAIVALLAALRGENLHRPPPTNLAFVFLDAALGLTNVQIQDIKDTTRRRRCADKKLLPRQVDRLHGAWLQPESFEWIMSSENLTRCFWRPYQERLFWERMGFKVPVVKKGVNDPNKWVNYYVQELTKRFHRGSINASMLDNVDPNDRSYLDDCLKQWSKVSLMRMKARLRPSSASSAGAQKSESPAAKRARTISSIAAPKSAAQRGSSDAASSGGNSVRRSPRVSKDTAHKALVLKRAIPKSGVPSHSPPPGVISVGAAQAAMVGTGGTHATTTTIRPSVPKAAELAKTSATIVPKAKRATPKPSGGLPSAVPPPLSGTGRLGAARGAGAAAAAAAKAGAREENSQKAPHASPIEGGSPRGPVGEPKSSSSSPTSNGIQGQAMNVQASGGLSESEIRRVVASQLDMSSLTRRTQFTLKAPPPPPPPPAAATAKASPRLKAAAAKSKPTIDIPDDDTQSSAPPTPVSDEEQPEPGKIGAIAARLAAMNKTPTGSPVVGSPAAVSAKKSPLPRGKGMTLGESPKPAPKLGSPAPALAAAAAYGGGASSASSSSSSNNHDVLKRDSLLAMVAQGIRDLRKGFADGSWMTSKERETLQELLES